MVGPTDLRNAVSLNSVLVNVASAVGPAIAGIVIAAGGIGVCFLRQRRVSFVAVVASLARLDVAKLQPPSPPPRGPGQLREGLRYVRRTPGAGGAAADDGARRLPGLRVPGGAADRARSETFAGDAPPTAS